MFNIRLKIIVNIFWYFQQQQQQQLRNKNDRREDEHFHWHLKSTLALDFSRYYLKQNASSGCKNNPNNWRNYG